MAVTAEMVTVGAHSSWADARPRSSGAVRMRYGSDTAALRKHMEAAGCFVSRKVALDANGHDGLVAGASIALGELLASCPVDVLVSHERASANALSHRCNVSTHCCVPLQVLDVLATSAPSSTAYVLAREHLQLLPESGAHLLPGHQQSLQCLQSEVSPAWRAASERVMDIACKDDPDLGFLARASLHEWARHQALSARAFAVAPASSVLFPLLDQMDVATGEESNSALDHEWVRRRGNVWQVVAPRAYAVHEPLLRFVNASAFDLWLRFGRAPDGPTPFDRVWIAPSALTLRLSSVDAVQAQQVRWLGDLVESMGGTSSLYLTRDDVSPALRLACLVLEASEAELHREDFLQRLRAADPPLSARQRRACVGPVAAALLKRSRACVVADPVRALVALERNVLEAHVAR